MLRSTGTSLPLVHRYDANLPGWQMQPSDQFYVGDFNGDKKADLWASNGGAGRRPRRCQCSSGDVPCFVQISFGNVSLVTKRIESN